MNVKERIKEFNIIFNPIFEQEILEILEEQKSFSGRDFPLDSEIKDILVPYARGGKRVRPFLIYYFSDRDILDSDIKNMCLAMELFHLAALIHDDIIDQSDLRHGVPALHYGIKKFEENNNHLGLDLAILLGDLFLVKSLEKASHLPHHIFKEFSTMVSRTIRGQHIDSLGMNYPYGETPYEEVMERHLLKTSWYTFASPARLGILLHANNNETEKVTPKLLELGILFQIRDDIIDCIDVEHGKKPFADIFDNQTTWVTLHIKKNYPDIFNKILAAKDAGQRESLKEIFSSIDLKSEYVLKLKEITNHIEKLKSSDPQHYAKLFNILELLLVD